MWWSLWVTASHKLSARRHLSYFKSVNLTSVPRLWRQRLSEDFFVQILDKIIWLALQLFVLRSTSLHIFVLAGNYRWSQVLSVGATTLSFTYSSSETYQWCQRVLLSLWFWQNDLTVEAMHTCGWKGKKNTWMTNMLNQTQLFAAAQYNVKLYSL